MSWPSRRWSGHSRLRRPGDRRCSLALGVGDKETLLHRDQAVLGRYLALGLEFQLDFDIRSTAVAPTIAEVEILAFIVVIRTALNNFLSKEIERERQEVEAARRTQAANDPELHAASS